MVKTTVGAVILSSQDRNYSAVGVRGFARGGDYNSRILRLLDGLRMNANVYGEADYGRGAIIVNGSGH